MRMFEKTELSAVHYHRDGGVSVTLVMSRGEYEKRSGVRMDLTDVLDDEGVMMVVTVGPNGGGKMRVFACTSPEPLREGHLTQFDAIAAMKEGKTLTRAGWPRGRTVRIADGDDLGDDWPHQIRLIGKEPIYTTDYFSMEAADYIIMEEGE